PPQLRISETTLVSQPSMGFMLQSAKPIRHAPTPQAPLAHTGMAFFAMHPLPQAPQFFTSCDRSAQAPAQHICPLQSLPHAPQFLSEPAVSTQVWAQHADESPPPSAVRHSMSILQ